MQVAMILIGILCNVFVAILLIGVVRGKYANIYNSIRKQETKTDYAFWNVPFEKTRGMNLKSNT